MTNLEALQSLTEYSNVNLFTKILLDRGVTGSGTYVAANAQDIDMCYADVLLYLAQHPDIKDGSTSIKYTPGACIAARARLYTKWGLALPGNEGPSMSGENPSQRAWW